MAARVTPEMCIAGRELTEPKLDPSGARLAFAARGPTATAIVLVDLDDDHTVERQLTTLPAPTTGRGMFGGCFDWLPDGTALVYAGDGALWLQPVPGGAVQRLTPTEPGRPAQAPGVAPDGTFVAYVADQAELWLQPLDGGPARRLDDGRHDFCSDPAVDPTSALISYQAWSVPDMPWDGAEVVTVAADGRHASTWRPVGGAAQQARFAPDGTAVCVHDGSGWLQVSAGEGRAVVAGGEMFEHADPSWGPGQASYAVSPNGRHVALARNERGFGRLCVIDVGTGSLREVARGVHGQLSWRGGRVAALRSGARTPTEIVVYDEATWERRVIAVGPVAGWDGVDLVEPELVALDRDGVTLHARRYVAPVGGGGRLLVMLHGGPTGQWPVTFMPRIAYWVDQGWDVLLPDHRGSTGHGREYQQALRGRWGELDVADTVAWLDHAHAAGWAEPSSTVVMGGSSGGYTVLRLLGGHPGRVAGGVALYPVTDVADLAARSHRFEAHSTISLVGPLDDRELYASRSAMAVVDEISAPLLVLHGTADPVVPVEGTVAFVDALRQRGADVELHLFEDEGHGFRQVDNQLAEYRLIREFLIRVARQDLPGLVHLVRSPVAEEL